jgi:hypothetical protein
LRRSFTSGNPAALGFRKSSDLPRNQKKKHAVALTLL